jgi:alkyl hydroperoxide reductase subunit F
MLPAYFVAIGLLPNADIVKDLVNLNQVGEVPINCDCETDIPGLFAAGDVTTVPEKKIAVAVDEGVKASLQAHRYLRRIAN